MMEVRLQHQHLLCACPAPRRSDGSGGRQPEEWQMALLVTLWAPERHPFLIWSITLTDEIKKKQKKQRMLLNDCKVTRQDVIPSVPVITAFSDPFFIPSTPEASNGTFLSFKIYLTAVRVFIRCRALEVSQTRVILLCKLCSSCQTLRCWPTLEIQTGRRYF